MSAKRWTIGITHLVKPPFTPESTAFDGEAEFIHFDQRDESGFDPAMLRKLDAFLVWTPAITGATRRHLERCRILVRYGVGYDKVDIDELGRGNIAFSNNPEYGPEDVADTALSMILPLQRRVLEHDRRARGYGSRWQENLLTPTRQLRHATVGVVGVGRIGLSVVNRLRPFGCRVLGYDPYLSNGMFRAMAVERVNDLRELAARCDVLTLHCPLTAETRGMINQELLAAARPGLVLVNTARGKLVDGLDTIEHGLRTGRLAGVGLDVLPEEPPAPHALLDAWRNDEDYLRGRLLINPHTAFYSDESFAECRQQAAVTARLFLEDGVHRNAVLPSNAS